MCVECPAILECHLPRHVIVLDLSYSGEVDCEHKYEAHCFPRRYVIEVVKDSDLSQLIVHVCGRVLRANVEEVGDQL